mmetsp:Transcript_6786/g.21508  ORF Transcript_6786/g.21508 Transcript_6786/m.21508 type:complete len:223 (-) Transcript_6786:785-1453(-)
MAKKLRMLSFDFLSSSSLGPATSSRFTACSMLKSSTRASGSPAEVGNKSIKTRCTTAALMWPLQYSSPTKRSKPTRSIRKCFSFSARSSSGNSAHASVSGLASSASWQRARRSRRNSTRRAGRDGAAAVASAASPSSSSSSQSGSSVDPRSTHKSAYMAEKVCCFCARSTIMSTTPSRIRRFLMPTLSNLVDNRANFSMVSLFKMPRASLSTASSPETCTTR